MNKNSNLWFKVQYLQNFAWTIGSLFLSVFIWQKTSGVMFLYKYYLSLFVFIPVAGFVGAMLSSKWSVKFSFIAAFTINASTMIFAALYPDLFLEQPILFGALNGSAIGLYAIPSNITMQELFSKNVSGASAKLSSLFSVNSLIIPFFGSFWIFLTGSYKGIFIAASLIMALAIFVLLKMHFENANHVWDWKSIVSFYKSRDFRLFNLLWFFSGIKNGLMWSVFGVVLLKLMGGEIAQWGFINTVSAVVGILSGIFYSKFVAGKSDAASMMTASVLFTALGVVLIADFNVVSFTVFFIGTDLMQTFISSSVAKLVGNIMRESEFIYKSSYEYYSVQEIPLALGRFIPLFLLFMFGSELDKNIVLVLIFFIVSTVPLVSTFIIQKMRSYKREVAEEL